MTDPRTPSLPPPTIGADARATRWLRRPALAARPNRVLVPIDFGSGAAIALREAAAIAHAATEIVLLHVIDPRFFGRGADAGDDFAHGSIVQDCAHHLVEVRDRALGAAFDARIVVRQGPAAAEIVRAARDLRADVVVLAVDGELTTAAGDTAAHATARAVLERCEAPVLVLRSD